MTSYLVFVSCLLDMNEKSTTGTKGKKNIEATGERKSNFGSLTFWVSQSVPLLRHLRGNSL